MKGVVGSAIYSPPIEGHPIVNIDGPQTDTE